MEQIINISRKQYNQSCIIKYIEDSDNIKLIEIKKLCIKSLGFLQLLITTLDDSNLSDINDIIAELEILTESMNNKLIYDNKDNDYEKYIN